MCRISTPCTLHSNRWSFPTLKHLNISLEYISYKQHFNKKCGVAWTFQRHWNISQGTAHSWVVWQFEGGFPACPRPPHVSELRRKLINGRCTLRHNARHQIVSSSQMHKPLAKKNHQNWMEWEKDWERESIYIIKLSATHVTTIRERSISHQASFDFELWIRGKTRRKCPSKPSAPMIQRNIYKCFKCFWQNL